MGLDKPSSADKPKQQDEAASKGHAGDEFVELEEVPAVEPESGEIKGTGLTVNNGNEGGRIYVTYHSLSSGSSALFPNFKSYRPEMATEIKAALATDRARTAGYRTGGGYGEPYTYDSEEEILSNLDSISVGKLPDEGFHSKGRGGRGLSSHAGYVTVTYLTPNVALGTKVGEYRDPVGRTVRYHIYIDPIKDKTKTMPGTV